MLKRYYYCKNEHLLFSGKIYLEIQKTLRTLSAVNINMIPQKLGGYCFDKYNLWELGKFYFVLTRLT